MNCPECNSNNLKKAGSVTYYKQRKPVKRQRWLCKNCGLYTIKPKDNNENK